MKRLTCDLNHMSPLGRARPRMAHTCAGHQDSHALPWQRVGGQSRSLAVARSARFRRFEIVRVTKSDTHLGVAG
jgi:hypothetical protein